MIHEVDRSLAELIRAEVVHDGDVDVVFDAPTKEWASRRRLRFFKLLSQRVADRDPMAVNCSHRELAHFPGLVLND